VLANFVRQCTFSITSISLQLNSPEFTIFRFHVVDSFNCVRMQSGEFFKHTATQSDDGLRLDQWITEILGEESSRSQIQRWIKAGLVQINGKVSKASYKLEEGDECTFTVPEPEIVEQNPVDLKIRVVYEDDDLAVIVKPAGISVHPGPGQNKESLLNGLQFLWKDLPPGNDGRPGIVHRLDRPTEGLMLIAKNEKAHRKLASAFQNRKIEKDYMAWLLATPTEQAGRVEAPLRRHPHDRLKMHIHPTGREAITLYKVEKSLVTRQGRKYSLVRLRILTGRTHQIRVHMAHLGCPVVGDALYSRSSAVYEEFGLLLLAWHLRFAHPTTGEIMTFELPLPQRFVDFEKKMESQKS
jgi:23S rRNA pseudouridine1911/1915/1917 synthase